MASVSKRTREVTVGRVKLGSGHPLVLIAGPCVIESESLVLQTAEKILKVVSNYGIGYIFKSSYLKDNRSSLDKYSGPGIEKGLKILEKLKKTFQIPVLTRSEEHTSELQSR